MTEGIIYYNKGTKMLVRLAVSLSSLRQCYDGDATILSEGDLSHDTCQKLAQEFGVSYKEVEYKTKKAKNDTYLNASLSHEKTPYDLTVWLDSDTLVIRNGFPFLFYEANKYEFAIAQIANWETGGKIGKRIKMWKDIYPEFIQPALDFGPAINCGVFSFSKDSKLMKDWWTLAEKGQHLFIPDETCCQLILPQYPHAILPQEYNCSCKHSDPYNELVYIIHYHGRKHCRIKDGSFLNGCNLWYSEFDKVRYLPFVERHIQHDRQLKQHLQTWDSMK